MEGVNHIHVLQIRSGGLIGHIHGMLQGQIPNGEGFKLSIASLNPALIFMIQLGQAGSHLATARSGGSHHHQRAGGLYIIVASITLIADNMLHIMRITLDGIMEVNLNIQCLQLLFEAFDRFLPFILGNNNAAHV